MRVRHIYMERWGGAPRVRFAISPIPPTQFGRFYFSFGKLGGQHVVAVCCQKLGRLLVSFIMTVTSHDIDMMCGRQPAAFIPHMRREQETNYCSMDASVLTLSSIVLQSQSQLPNRRSHLSLTPPTKNGDAKQSQETSAVLKRPQLLPSIYSILLCICAEAPSSYISNRVPDKLQ